jgi:hypothetical protein
MPIQRVRKPRPPPSVAPDKPTLPSVPVVTAKFCFASVVTASSWLSPEPTVAMREAVSMWTDFSSLMSITRPLSTFDQPSRLWRPLRIRSATSFCRAHVRAFTTSWVFWAKTITSG